MRFICGIVKLYDSWVKRNSTAIQGVFMGVEILDFPSEKDWEEVKRRALVTCGLKPVTPPAPEWKKAMLEARHSPIRYLRISYLLTGIPYWLSCEICRHHAGVEKFVKSQRNDRQQKFNRAEARQDSPVDMIIDFNGESVQTFFNKRLCRMAAPEMRALCAEMKSELEKVCAEIRGLLVPACGYGRCHEMNPCGGNEQ